MDISTATRVRPHATGLGFDVAGTGKTLIPAIRPTIYRGERGKWDVDLVITRPSRCGRYQHRFGVGYVDPTGKCRREYQGEIVPGPYGFAFGLATCISAHPGMSTRDEVGRNRGAGTEHEVAEGDLIQLGYELFAVRYERDQWIKLDHVGSVI